MARPSLLGLCLDVAFRHLLTRRRRPLLASYKLTYSCNLRCQQCPFRDYPAPDASYELVCRTLDRMVERGDRLVIFEGGEPLLWHDGKWTFNDVVRYARQRFACVGVTTNGTLPLDLETDIAWVSLDGLAETHNRLRGAEVFELIIAHLRAARHPRLYAHITANAENAAEIPALVQYITGLVRGITVQFYYPYGPDDRLFLPWLARRTLLRELIRLKSLGYPILNSVASLRMLEANTWRCQPWRIDCADPDGSLWNGCYLTGRAVIDCSKCGFSPYTEMSLAFQGNPRAILAGLRIFG